MFVEVEKKKLRVLVDVVTRVMVMVVKATDLKRNFHILPGISKDEIRTQSVGVEYLLAKVRILQNCYVVMCSAEVTFHVCEALLVVGSTLSISYVFETSISSGVIVSCICFLTLCGFPDIVLMYLKNKWRFLHALSPSNKCAYNRLDTLLLYFKVIRITVFIFTTY